MDDLLKRLETQLSASQFLKLGDLFDELNGQRAEAAARIRALESLTRGQEEQLEIQGNELARRASRCNELGDRIRELEAQLAEARADGWRRGIEAAAAAADDMRKELWTSTPAKWVSDIQALHKAAATIRALPLPADLGVRHD